MNGLHLILLIFAAVAALASIQRSGELRPASVAVNFPLWFVICTGVGSFIAGSGLLLFKTFKYLTGKHWPRIDNATFLDWLGARPASPGGWILDMLSWDAVVTLMAALPGTLLGLFTVGMIVVVYAISGRRRQSGLGRAP